MSWILRIIWFLFKKRLEGRFLGKAKLEGLKVYLRLLQGSRRLLMLVLATVLIFQLMLFSALGALVTGFLVWDYDFHTKMQILLGIFLFLFLAPAALLFWGLSERVWLNASGARDWMDDINSSK